jgi:hypothetical protein
MRHYPGWSMEAWANEWRNGRVVECGGLENRCSASAEPGVRIPLSPQSLNAPLQAGFFILPKYRSHARGTEGSEAK